MTEIKNITFQGGRKPNDPSKPRVRLTRFLDTSVVTSPVSVDYHTKVPNWQMYLNDRLGDCTCADLGHTLMQTSLYGSAKEVVVTDQDILTAYKAVSGYNGTPETDNGAVIQEVQAYFRKTGVGGHKSLAFAEVDITNHDELYAAINLFGHVHLGMNFPAFAMDQFNSGRKWDLQSTNNQIDGGHDVVAVGYDKAAGLIYVVTWGAVQPVTLAFFDKYFEEGWISILPEWLNSAGKSPTGLDLYGLGEEVAALTSTTNPFPAPAPTPTPVPTPVPVPPVVDADAALWAKLKDWAHAKHVTTNKAAATAVLAWAKGKGFS